MFNQNPSVIRLIACDRRHSREFRQMIRKGLKMDDDLSVKYQEEIVQQIAAQQYGILVDSLNKINETRENSNNFWIGANGLVISVLAYLRDAQNIHQTHKSLFLITLIIIGMLFSLSWLSYLGTIKKSVEIRSDLLIKLERNLPIPVFSKIFDLSQEKVGKAALTVKEMFVPCLFLVGYLFFAVLVFFFPQEILSTTVNK